MIRTIAILALAMVLSACAGTPFKWDDARKIQPGMQLADVKQILGAPNVVRAEGDTVRYVWVEANALAGSTKTLRIDFKDGKVIKAPPIPDEFK